MKGPWSNISGRWEWDVPCDPGTLNLGWLKQKRFGMAVEKSGLVFCVEKLEGSSGDKEGEPRSSGTPKGSQLPARTNQELVVRTY